MSVRFGTFTVAGRGAGVCDSHYTRGTTTEKVTKSLRPSDFRLSNRRAHHLVMLQSSAKLPPPV